MRFSCRDNVSATSRRLKAAVLLPLTVASLLAIGGSALALRPTTITPQGEKSQISQFSVTFDKDAIVAGNSQATAPYTISCKTSESNGKVPAHHGAWRNATTWAADFENDLPPNTHCSATPVAGFKAPNGEPLPAQAIHFNTGDAFVQRVSPSSQISEDQVFVLRFNGAANPTQIQTNSQCRVQGIGELIGTELVTGKVRNQILESEGYSEEAEKQGDRFVLLRCARTLPQNAEVQLRLAAKSPQEWDFKVRPPFEASFSCERSNAQSDCLPVRPLSVKFNAPVSMKQAKKIVLKQGDKSIEPTFNADQAKADFVEEVQFTGILPERASFRIELPSDLKDDAGRALSNANSFPLQVKTAAMPALVKFAATPFGIVERFAEGKDNPALLPMTVRNVPWQGQQPNAQTGSIRSLRISKDADIIAWLNRLNTYDETTVSRTTAQKDGIGQLPPPWPKKTKKDDDSYRLDDAYIESRAVSLLNGQSAAKKLQLPTLGKESNKEMEVVGLPLEAGFHVVEVESPTLGNSLFGNQYGKDRPMYVRTSALVTNLGVHFKHGRSDSLVWVTSLNDGKPVENATVAINTCNGKVLAQGTTNAQGVLRIEQPLQGPHCSGDEVRDSSFSSGNLFISARTKDDMAFVWSDWHKGIEAWRFNVPTSDSFKHEVAAHTVFDRTLLRAGETVSMQHFVRAVGSKGLQANTNLPTAVRMVHTGSDEKFELPITWRKTSSGGHIAESTWPIPAAAKLGQYRSLLVGKNAQGEPYELFSGFVRVEEFRLPTMTGSISTNQSPLVALKKLPVQVQLAYINGGAASNLPVEVSASAKPAYLHFKGYDDYSFEKSEPQRPYANEDDSDNEDGNPHQSMRMLADRQPLKLGTDGAGKLEVKLPEEVERPLDVTLEASYSDPNGEIQTVQSRQRVWPSAIVAGIKTEGWVSVNKDVRFQALALNTQGQPQAGAKLKVRAIAHTTTTSRKRLVGGFYTYDNDNSTKDLGEVCSGKSDDRGLLLCTSKLGEVGEIELVATAYDGDGNTSEASASVTVTSQGELWFGGNDNDRMDVLAEKQEYKVGETAKFQVRMPFRYATALVTVEREGILHSEIVQLNGKDPTVELKIQPEWGPNAYVSVMALRGRLRDVPWYSFFTWGYRQPGEWWRAFWHDGKEYAAPTAMVDLSKPAFRLGMAPIQVGVEGYAMQIDVKPSQTQWKVRETVPVTIQAKLPNGQPAANAEVALAVVDQALLELMPNNSWDLLKAMYQQRAWGVETATAQMEIIGRRHYGRKAAPAGGDGGGAGRTRELLDTLVLWQPKVQLDANGQATVNVPLKDALSSFAVVAIGSYGQEVFGTGKASIRTTQDLQIISGLPALVREGDQYRAMVTVRNTTDKDMDVELVAKTAVPNLPATTKTKIAAGAAYEWNWDVQVPMLPSSTTVPQLVWELSAQASSGSKASDQLRVVQKVDPAVPLTVQQATLSQVDGSLQMNLAAPPQSLMDSDNKAARGGVKVALQPTLAGGLPGVRDWFNAYPYTCLEQQTSKAIGLGDTKLWKDLMGQLPTYLDSDGLASYFPASAGQRNSGSDALTAHLLAITQEAGAAWQLPGAQRDAMLAGLTRFVEGRIERSHYSPRSDRDVRKLVAIEALSRYGRATPAMLSSIAITPEQWPTHGVIAWASILQRLQGISDAEQQLSQAIGILRSRMSYQGTKLAFSTEANDNWWWVMENGDTNSARLLLTMLPRADWERDMPALLAGLVARQHNGAWATTIANVWGALALEKFAAKFEKAPVAGQTQIALQGQSASIDWSKVQRLTAAQTLPRQTGFGAPVTTGSYVNNQAMLAWQQAAGATHTLQVTHKGSGKPWVTVQSIAAVPLTAAQSAGFTVRKSLQPVKVAKDGKTLRGDIWRVRLDIQAAADMTWVAVNDPIAAGSTILGSGLGRDSAIATEGESNNTSGDLAFVERGQDAYRAYFAYLPKGNHHVEYTVRLNNAGRFKLPPTRVEALYAPEIFGAAPNATLDIEHNQ